MAKQAYARASAVSQSKQKRNTTAAKRTVKYLSVCTSPQAYRAVLRSAPAEVIKRICDAACNIEHGPIYL